MNGELSHSLPWLITSGNRILRSDTLQPVLLRGVNRSGLEYTEPTGSGFLAPAGLTQDEVREIVSSWGASVIRIPFNQDWALGGRHGHSAEEYLSSLDQVISWTAALGAYTILDLQWLDAETVYGTVRDQNGVRRPNHVAPTPNGRTIELWRMLAQRYRDEPAVLFDLFNEPHDPLSDDFLNIHVINPDSEVVESDRSFVGPEEWIPWAERLVTEIRSIRLQGIVLLAGVDWAFDLTGIRLEQPNVVYSAHIYSNRKQRTWDKALGGADEVPIFIGEWGGTEKDLDFGGKLAARLTAARLGWTAWSWVDYPVLVQAGAPGYDPTPFGALVRDQLRAPLST